MKIIPEIIREAINYDPVSGQLFKNGEPVTHKTSHGYLELRFRTTKYYAHRVAWFLVTGEQPQHIDHVNGNREDNCWFNLRSGTRSQNMLNSKSHRRGQKPGVYFNKDQKKWRLTIPASMSKTGKQLYIGSYDSLDLANEAFHEFFNKGATNEQRSEID